MKTLKYFLILMIFTSVCWGQTIRQNQVRALPDSLVKKLDISKFSAYFNTNFLLKTLDDIAAGATYKAVTDSEKAVWNAKLDTTAADGRYKQLNQDGYIDTTAVITLADSATVIFPVGVAGWGKCMIGNNQERAVFTFDSTGAITLDSALISTNISTTFDTANKLVIYDTGSGIGIQNMLGYSLKLAFKIEYYTP